MPTLITFSRKLPTEPGWYIRRYERSDGGFYCYVVQLVEFGGKLFETNGAKDPQLSTPPSGEQWSTQPLTFTEEQK